MALSISRSGVTAGQTIRLEVEYFQQGGTPTNPDSTPSVEILAPDPNNPGNFIVVVPLSSTSVQQLEPGLFYFDFLVPANSTLGAWEDHWTTTVNSVPLDAIFNFMVVTNQQAITVQAHQTLDPKLSDTATQNVYELINLLKARLGSDGQKRVTDAFGKYIQDVNGNFVVQACDIFTTEELYIFLKASLAEFNSIPHFTYFTFDNAQFTIQFAHELTEGAYILALAKQGIQEKGREFVINDDGVSFQPPTLGDYIKGYLSDFMNRYTERLKFIKANMKPAPLGVGTVYSWASGGAAPAWMRLRHLRARQII